MKLRNLVGDTSALEVIKNELMISKIEFIDKSPDGEPLEKPHGELAGFFFYRCHTHWIAKGEIPVKAIEEIETDPIGKEYIGINQTSNRHRIESLIALRFFADILRKHNLA
ncbi:MAG: hypothetical protein WCO84_00480 [bacterium]